MASSTTPIPRMLAAWTRSGACTSGWTAPRSDGTRRASGSVATTSTKEDRMAIARVVTFEGVSKDRMDQMKQEMESGEAPEGFPSSELLVLHDPEAESSEVVVIFQNEDDYRKGDEILNAMPAGDTPGQRTSVKKYDVAMRMSN